MTTSKPKTEDTIRTLPSAMVGSGLPMAVGYVAVQAWMEMGTEAVRFVWDRLQQDRKTQHAMLACTSLEDMRKIQAEFFTAAQEQYAAEAAKMLGLMGKATSLGLATAKGRRYDDLPL